MEHGSRCDPVSHSHTHPPVLVTVLVPVLHRDGQADQAAGCVAPPTQNSAIDRGIRGDWNQDSSCCWAGACLEGRNFLGDKIILRLVQGRPFMGACNDQT